VPDTLARAGFAVTAHGGPGPEDYYSYEFDGTTVAERRTGRRPQHADIVFSYRPLEELPGILESAIAIGANVLWFQDDGSANGAAIASAEDRVLRAGLTWIASPILDAIR